MKPFSEYRRDALRYRALVTTEKASPWKDVLGPHTELSTLADALVGIAQKEGNTLEATEYAGLTLLEDAPGMSIGGGEGLAGVKGEPPVSKLAQRKWIKKNCMMRRTQIK